LRYTGHILYSATVNHPSKTNERRTFIVRLWLHCHLADTRHADLHGRLRNPSLCLLVGDELHLLAHLDPQVDHLPATHPLSGQVSLLLVPPMKTTEKILKYIRETPERQIEWFGSDNFMWIVFALFFAAMALLIHLNPA